MNGIDPLLSKLSPPDLLELYYFQRAAIVDDLEIFMTGLFGFLIASFLLGQKFKKAESILVTTLYSLFSLLLIGSISDEVRSIANTMSLATGVYPSHVPYLLPAICLVGWLSSIWYMFKQQSNSSNA